MCCCVFYIDFICSGKIGIYKNNFILIFFQSRNNLLSHVKIPKSDILMLLCLFNYSVFTFLHNSLTRNRNLPYILHFICSNNYYDISSICLLKYTHYYNQHCSFIKYITIIIRIRKQLTFNYGYKLVQCLSPIFCYVTFIHDKSPNLLYSDNFISTTNSNEHVIIRTSTFNFNTFIIITCVKLSARATNVLISLGGYLEMKCLYSRDYLLYYVINALAWLVIGRTRYILSFKIRTRIIHCHYALPLSLITSVIVLICKNIVDEHCLFISQHWRG